jgi:hypothetical protein
MFVRWIVRCAFPPADIAQTGNVIAVIVLQFGERQHVEAIASEERHLIFHHWSIQWNLRTDTGDQQSTVQRSAVRRARGITPRCFQSGMSSFIARGSITAPERMCEPAPRERQAQCMGDRLANEIAWLL